jgi:hypothetical protein
VSEPFRGSRTATTAPREGWDRVSRCDDDPGLATTLRPEVADPDDDENDQRVVEGENTLLVDAIPRADDRFAPPSTTA